MSDIMKRKKTNKIKVRGLYIGGEAPITVQSMTNTDTRNVRQTVEQIRRLHEVGCEIVRVAIPDMEAAEAVKKIRAEMDKFAYDMPLVADIHFDYRLAIASMKNGVDKVRLNPGNIGGAERVKAVVKVAKERGIPIRIGVNSGSVEKKIIARDKGVTAAGMVESALNHAKLLEDEDFDQIVISIKTSNVLATIETYRLVSERCNYPLHLGVTHAGGVYRGIIKSAMAMAILLSEGIGDTIRVSLTGDAVQEVKAGIEILKSLGFKKHGVDIISCPTCGRCQMDLIKVAGQVEAALEHIEKPLTVAVVGCAVNGPGEAREADIGIAGGKGEALLFKKGEIIKKIPEDKIAEVLLEEILKM
ncbi:MAG: flavodoxin-dependent (E)-4-hydroxy-3-methylbut-2-enyl-diphosphate synthase [Peptococcia bacterium]|jgi:(E)-4-hydroxy-3-methylbut-2-enyl-diphosphate synthase